MGNRVGRCDQRILRRGHLDKGLQGQAGFFGEDGSGNEMTFGEGIWRLLVRISTVVALLFLATTGIGAETYRLATGDKVRAQIIGVGNETYIATVDGAGNIRLPYLGVHRAAGRSLDQLTQEIALVTAGIQIRRVVDGVETVIVLDEDDVFLDIETYRPITVTGAVAVPGRVPFEPGMSARSAIGSAGGAGLPGQFDRDNQLANWRTRRAELRQTEAWLAADIWRIESLLSGDRTEPELDVTIASLSERLDQDALDTIRDRVETTRARLSRETEDLDARIALTNQRIAFLNEALEQFKTASTIEEERLRDVLQLSDRGLTTVNVLDNARQGALSASSRLLTTQADLAEAERELQSLSLQQRGLEEELGAELLAEKNRAKRDLAETRSRLTSLDEEIALGSVMSEEDAATELAIMLHRFIDGEEVSQQIQPSVRLQPGDVIEVVVTGK